MNKLTRVLALATVSLLLSACGGGFWENYSKTERVYPEQLTTPMNVYELMDLVESASQDGKRIRMTGSGHSHSDVAITEDILLKPLGLTNVLELDRVRLKDPDMPQLVRVESGISIRNLNQYLDSQDLALQNMGGYDAQTIVGAAMTGTHGSGLNYGPIASQIVSLQVVVEGGELVQIEPDDGITDPATFPGHLEGDPLTPLRLIQDSELFNAAKVSVGSMGIVYSVVLQADRKFWLEEVRTIAKWEDVKAPGGFLDRLLKGEPLDDGDRQPEYYELQYNPYALGGDRTILITKRYKSYEPLEIDKERGAPGTEFLSGLITLFEKPLIWILDNFQFLAPLIIEQSLNSQADESYKNISYRVFHIGVVNHTDAYAVEMGFDLQESVEAIESAFEIGDQLKANGIIHSAPVSLRFVKAADEHIAMSQGRDTMILELIMINGIKGDRELFQTYAQTLLEEYHARPHWGLDLKLLQGTEWVEEIYPMWHEWLGQYESTNINGTFDGKVTDRLNISVNPR